MYFGSIFFNIYLFNSNIMVFKKIILYYLLKKIFIFVNDFEKKTKRISSTPDSNRCTREFSA